ncbi:unnamed protein product [Brassicogethes aeneus]|uniref:EF-hand domain-containing protein n=2 Tax=Brassicogethes aeneus TaxID=1431903 RepID=A0A9P0BC84_BRAAE|nr:unnamed protein product [Brassicogethes aeneus]
MPHCKGIKLGAVWRTCNKIRAAIFRLGLNLWEYFVPLDPQKNCLISESQFISVLSGQLRSTIGLSEQEISELADYFRVQDGRIFYTQLCQVIHDSIPDFAQNAPVVNGLEWEDPLHVNRLSISEERRLNILITKIASIVNMRKLILRPFFQDYELVAKNNGVVTIGHFARVLDYLQILLAADDFHLLVKKFIKDSYTINYIAFIAAVQEVVNYMNANGVMDLGGDLLSLFPGRIISSELPKLPRPEIGKISAASVFGRQTIFHPVLNEPKRLEQLLILIQRIQRHVLENRIRVSEFFKHFDPLNCGKITVSQFHRGLDSLGVSGLHKLFLSLTEIETVMMQYQDPSDPTRICWRTFEDDIDQVFTTKELEKRPLRVIDAPPMEILELPRKGAKHWQSVNLKSRELCEEAVDKVKQKTMKRRILLKPVFRDYDKNNNGHVTRNQMRQALHSNGILLSDEELFSLEERFNNDMGFNYFWFLREVDPKPQEDALYTGFIEEMKKLNREKPKAKATRQEKDIVQIMAKVKGKVVRERIRAVEEAFTQSCLERSPLTIPLQHIPTKDCEKNFLNFDERKILGIAMQKLSKKPDLQMNLYPVLRDYDKENCGTISEHQFQKALILREMMDLISPNEFEVICKCFSFERGMRQEIDYRAFMKALDILYATDKYNPF